MFGLGSEARMNVPGRARDNWAWRALPAHFTPALATRLRRLAELSGRLAGTART
jgi:4-alpha-glucanotransferase